MFWTIVFALIFVFFLLPIIISVGGYLIGLGLIIGLFYVLGSFAIEVLRELSNSLSQFSLSELPILPFAIVGALLIFGVILRYFFRVVKFPSIFSLNFGMLLLFLRDKNLSLI